MESSSKSLEAVSSPSEAKAMDCLPSESDSQFGNLLHHASWHQPGNSEAQKVPGPSATIGQPSSSGGFSSQAASVDVEAKPTGREALPEILDLNDGECLLSTDNYDSWDVMPDGMFRDPYPITQAKPTGKRVSESLDFPVGKKPKVKKQIDGPAKHAIKEALKDLGIKEKNLSYLDTVTPEMHVKTLKDLVLIMAARVNLTDAPLIPKIMKSKVDSEGVIQVWNNLDIRTIMQQQMKWVEGYLFCRNCNVIHKAMVDWREGYVCLTSYLLSKWFKVGRAPPSINSFSLYCPSCSWEASEPCSKDDYWNFLFIALTNSVGFCPKETIMGYLRGRNINISLEAKTEDIILTFYVSIITDLDPTNVLWNELRCRLVASAVSNGESA